MRRKVKAGAPAGPAAATVVGSTAATSMTMSVTVRTSPATVACTVTVAAAALETVRLSGSGLGSPPTQVTMSVGTQKGSGLICATTVTRAAGSREVTKVVLP